MQSLIPLSEGAALSMCIAETLKIIVALVIATQETVTVQMVASVLTVNVDPLF
jgi:hypothetical protein